MTDQLSKPRCDQCFWWALRAKSKTIDPDEGECRALPPQLGLIAYHAFPKILANQWCARWLTEDVRSDPFNR
jgi:hypothetical protein